MFESIKFIDLNFAATIFHRNWRMTKKKKTREKQTKWNLLTIFYVYFFFFFFDWMNSSKQKFGFSWWCCCCCRPNEFCSSTKIYENKNKHRKKANIKTPFDWLEDLRISFLVLCSARMQKQQWKDKKDGTHSMLKKAKRIFGSPGECTHSHLSKITAQHLHSSPFIRSSIPQRNHFVVHSSQS